MWSMTEVPFLGVRIEGGIGEEVDDVGIYELDEKGYGDDATKQS